MRRSSPYCQSNTPAKAQSPVKIIQRSRGARSGTLKASMSDDMVVTLMFFVLHMRKRRHSVPPFRTSCEPKRPRLAEQLPHGTHFFRHSGFGVPRTQRSAYLFAISAFTRVFDVLWQCAA